MTDPDEESSSARNLGKGTVYYCAAQDSWQAQGNHRREERDWTSVPSVTSGISVAFDSDGAGARSGSGSRGVREASMHGRTSEADESGGSV